LVLFLAVPDGNRDRLFPELLQSAAISSLAYSASFTCFMPAPKPFPLPGYAFRVVSPFFGTVTAIQFLVLAQFRTENRFAPFLESL